MREEDDLSGGSHVLHLAFREGDSISPLIESRAAYVSLVDQTQPDALLRAIYWDSQTVKRDSPPETTPVAIAAKFVRVPFERIQQWLSVFDNLHPSLQVSLPRDDDVPLCSLRIEIDPTCRVFEKVWPVLPGEDIELNHAWQTVWRQMGAALQTYPAVTDIEEQFPCAEPEPDSYDFQAYQPSLDLS
jgi:hypothetical protein